ncbi:hypothetical protein MGYG_07460 [Nannizzia gypsea CBS 118893]|uniref:Shelterin complex subunit TPP1/Est3 domain-containing protein n=1 Tax=Arthroderma gypseum (strain ATCC MYA-4604 / CBS 118893) TaxID=535722 RepID=E4V378_ARTGP|nr:hypothetical protein MGYG_07460 [Nannizzia gypsea CBS 118893]EFR04452.1 hypothetical protein MGYG_07460 [Nannizzia gypsea CBS 118893]
MDLLKDWIEPLVEQAFRQSVDTEAQKKPSCRELGKTIDDGSNFRTPVKRPKYTQLLEWLPKTPTPQAVLSDGHTCIRARFSERVCQDFKKENGSDIRSNPTPCLLRLSKLEITIAQLYTSPPEITLYIDEIKVEGCVKEGVFGNPRNVVHSKAILKISDKWVGERRALARTLGARNDSSDDSDSECSVSPPDADNPSTMGSPEPASHRDDLMSTQEGKWYTQAPTHVIPQTPKTEGNEDSVAIQPLNSQDLMEALAPNRTASGNKPRRTSTKNDDKQDTSTPASRQTTSNATRVATAPLPGGTTPASVTFSPRGQASPYSASKLRRKPSAAPSQPDQHKAIPSHEVMTASASQHILSPESRYSNALPHQKESRATEPVVNRGFFSSWNKIRRRDVVIPESQLNLIQSADSWIPPDTGRRAPQNFVPIELLQEWSESHKARVSATRETNLQESPVLDNGEVASSVGSQIPDEDWPPSPSPQTPLVPLDSSPPQRTAKLSTTLYSNIPASDPTNSIDTSTRPQLTSAPSLVTKAGELSDDGSCQDSEIELSIPKDLYTSTQDCDVPAGSTRIENDEDITNVSETLLSQQIKSQPAHRSEEPQTPSTHHKRTHSNIQSAQSSTGSFSARGAKLKSPIHDPSTQKSLPNSDQMALASQFSGDWSGNSGNCNDSLSVLQVPGSSLENPNHNTAVLPSIETSTPILILDDTNQKRKSREYPKDLVGFSPAVPSQQNNKKFDRLSFSSQTEEIYYKFQQAYKKYTGNLAVFRKACCRLQSLRNEGLMKKSVLWDDFVAREVFEYQDYVQRCRQQRKKPNAYGDYFEKHAKFPLYKRRNLTVKNLQTVVTETEGESDCDSEHGDEVMEEATPELQHISTLQRAVLESPCKSETRDPESEKTDSEKDLEAPCLHNRASVELGDDTYFRVSINKPQKRKAAPFRLGVEDEESGEEGIFQSIRGRSHQPIRPSNEPAMVQSTEPDMDGIPTKKTYQKPSRSSSPLQKYTTASSHIKHKQPTLPSRSKPSRTKRSPAPSLPSNRKAPSCEKAGSAETPGSSTWWKDPNTSLKRFSRDYARIPGELGTVGLGLKSSDIPVDEAGVMLITPRKPLQKGGRMNSMGFRL